MLKGVSDFIAAHATPFTATKYAHLLLSLQLHPSSLLGIQLADKSSEISHRIGPTGQTVNHNADNLFGR